MTERHRLEPVDADVNVRLRFFAAGNVEVLAFRRTRTDEDRVVADFEQRFHALDRCVVTNLDPHLEDHLDLFVEHGLGQAERRDVGAHEAACLAELLEHDHLVAEWHQIVGHGKRRGAGADAGDLLSVLLFGDFRKAIGDVFPEVGGNALEPADGDGLFVDSRSTAGRLAGAIACSSENAREDVRLAVQHVGVGVMPLRNHPNVFGDVGVRGAGPLAIDDFVKVVWVTDIRGIQL